MEETEQPGIDGPLRAEWERLAQGLRGAVASSVELDVSSERMAELADRVEVLARELKSEARGKSVPLLGPPDTDDLDNVLPFSPIVGRLNPISPPLRTSSEGDRVSGRITLGAVYEGAPGLAHGAVIAAIYDDLLAMANIVGGSAGPTAKLTIRYRKPTPLHRELRLEAWVDQLSGRQIHTRGRCWDGDQLLSEAHGLFVQMGEEGFGGVVSRIGLESDPAR